MSILIVGKLYVVSSRVAPNLQQHKKNPHKLIPVQLKRKVQSTEDLSF